MPFSNFQQLLRCPFEILQIAVLPYLFNKIHGNSQGGSLAQITLQAVKGVWPGNQRVWTPWLGNVTISLLTILLSEICIILHRSMISLVKIKKIIYSLYLRDMNRWWVGLTFRTGQDIQHDDWLVTSYDAQSSHIWHYMWSLYGRLHHVRACGKGRHSLLKLNWLFL